MLGLVGLGARLARMKDARAKRGEAHGAAALHPGVQSSLLSSAVGVVDNTGRWATGCQDRVESKTTDELRTAILFSNFPGPWDVGMVVLNPIFHEFWENGIKMSIEATVVELDAKC